MDLLKRMLLIGFFLFSLVWLTKAMFLGNYPDFNVFYGGLKAYLHGGNPYLDVEGSTMKFLYPPFTLFFFIPVILFERGIASMIWVGFSILLLLISLAVLFKIEKKSIASNEFFLLSGLTFLMFTVKFNLGMGQFNNVNLLLVTLFLYFFNKKRKLSASMALSLSLLLKVFPLFFLMYLIILKRWKIVCLIGIIIILGLGLPFLFMDTSVVMYFFRTSIIGTIKSWPLDYYNQAFSGFMGRMFGTGDSVSMIKTLITVLLTLITFSILWIQRTNKKTYILGFSSLLPLTLSTLSFSWQHYFVLCIPSLVLLYFHYQKRKANLKYFIALGVSYVLIGSNLTNPTQHPVIVQSHMLWGTILLLALTLYEVYRYE